MVNINITKPNLVPKTVLDKLSKRGLVRMGKEPTAPIQPLAPTNAVAPQASPLPSISETISQPAQPASPLTSRIAQAPQRGPVGSLPQNQGIQKRIVADLPANVQIQGIQDIINGKQSTSPAINNFVMGMVQRGANPEQIRQSFIEEQKKSNNPLVLQ